MEFQEILVVLFLLVTGVFSTATSSIGVQCYNDNASYKDAKKNNYNFLIVNVVSAVSMILVASVILVLVVRGG